MPQDTPDFIPYNAPAKASGGQPDFIPYQGSPGNSEAQQVQQGLPPGPGGPVIPGGKMIPPLNAQQMSFGAMGGQIPSVEQAQNIVSAQKQVPAIVSGIRKGALAMGGASLGSLAPTALTRIATAGAGGALGTGAGSAISGEVPNPKEMAQVGAGMAAGSAVGEAAAPLVKWMTSSKSVGAQLLQQASAKAGNAPVELSPKTNEIVEKIATQSKLGGTMPKVVSDLLERVGPSTKLPAEAPPNPLTYDEARILQSNISQLSPEEVMKFKGSLKGLVKELAGSFSGDVQQAADNAGIGTEHAAGMREYAQASARNRTLEKVGKTAIKTAIPTGIAYEILRNVRGR